MTKVVGEHTNTRSFQTKDMNKASRMETLLRIQAAWGSGSARDVLIAEQSPKGPRTQMIGLQGPNTINIILFVP